jgi:GNAT superfamily N-acetyltransferase
MRAQEFVPDYEGMSLKISKDADGVAIRAYGADGAKELGMAEFFFDEQGRLDPQSVWVNERYHGQGIAAAMYDYLKSRGYTIIRSWDQTDAGKGFWDKHRGAKATVWEDTEEYLYHATYRPLLKSIQAKGLGNTTQSQWTDSRPGVVYLARDPEVARSYAETAESVPEDWLDQIIVLQISQKDLDADRLGTDQNVQDNTGDTLQYHGVIPANKLRRMQ